MKTKIKWHDSKKKLPKKSGNYLVVTKNGCITNMCYSSFYWCFNVLDTDQTPSHAIPTILWAKIPKELLCTRKEH